MPVLSFDDLDRSEKMPGYLGAFVHGENMTVTNWSVEAGASFPEHAHPHEQISLVVEGEFELTIDGTTETLTPGRVAVIPPDTLHSGQAVTACEIIDVFSPVREEYQ